MTYRTDLYNRYQSTFKARDGQSAKRHDSGEAIHPFRGWLPSDRRAPILDLGCGSGQLLYALQDLGYSNVAGVDIGPEQVKSARELGLNVEQADAISYLAEHVGHFQLMLACDVLEHLTRDEALRFLQHARHAAVPGGCLLLRVPKRQCPARKRLSIWRSHSRDRLLSQ